jgi:gliding motility-associated-like protein
MKKLYYLVIVLFTPFMLVGQENLFQNASFEAFSECFDAKTKESPVYVNDWGHAINQDTFPKSPCDTAWNLYLNAIESRTGKAVQYILTYYDDPRVIALDSRSYIVSELKKTLRADAYYYFKMYVRSVFNNPVNYCYTNGQAIAFSKVVPKPLREDEGPLKIVPVVQNEKLVDTSWTKISGCFKAVGGEKYAIIGNFKAKDKTLIKRIKEPTVVVTDPNAPDFVANFNNRSLTGSNLIDDVELIPLSLDFPKDTAICQGESLSLDVKNDLPATYQWQDGSTSSQFVVTKSGTYKVIISYTFGNESCKVEQSFNVDVLPKYREKPLVDSVICQFKSILLKVGTGRRDDVIKWQDNNSDKDTLRVVKNGTYTAQISNACGNYVESYKVNFIRCDINVFVPNAFSPNGDKSNDTFAPFIQADFPITDYEFAVYNRWGSQVFFSRDRDAFWDATFRNQVSESGLYTWYLKVTGQLGSKTVQKLETGDVMLMR